MSGIVNSTGAVSGVIGTTVGTPSGGANLDPGSGEVVINDTGADVNFRVESDTNQNQIFADAGLNQYIWGANSQASYTYPYSFQVDHGTFVLGIFSMATTAAQCVHMGTHSMSNDNNSQSFIIIGDNAALRFRVWTSGDYWSSDGGDINSDERLKENIVDATSKLDDINALKVRNFNWRTHDAVTGNRMHSDESASKKRINFIAQELEEVFPGLVNENNQYPDDDERGPVMRKSIRETALIPILVKGIQELSDKVDALESANTTLEARVTALENA